MVGQGRDCEKVMRGELLLKWTLKLSNLIRDRLLFATYWRDVFGQLLFFVDNIIYMQSHQVLLWMWILDKGK